MLGKIYALDDIEFKIFRQNGNKNLMNKIRYLNLSKPIKKWRT